MADDTAQLTALERASAVLAKTIRHACVDPDSDEAQFRVLEPFLITNITAALIAAESDAHAAAITECLSVVKFQKDDDARKRDAISGYSPDWKDKLEWSRQTCELIEKNILALATPAPEEKP